jgi:hypothetical protein
MLQFPPKQGFKFHHNVGVQVCLTSEMGYDGYGGLPKSLPLTDPQNSHWLKRLMRWKELTSHVYIWEYTQAAPWAAPMPDYFVVAENLATLHKLGATGWFAESTCCHPREEMVELKVYLWGRLSFDPTLNISHVTENFLSGFYGASVAPHVMKYLQVLDAAMRARGAGRTGDPRIWPTNSKAKRMASKWTRRLLSSSRPQQPNRGADTASGLPRQKQRSSSSHSTAGTSLRPTQKRAVARGHLRLSSRKNLRSSFLRCVHLAATAQP